MQTKRIPSRKRGSGFTLVELMIVVALMGIMAVSVIPAMDNVQQMRAGAARDDIARMLELTKARAMATGQPVGLMIDLSDSTLGIVEVISGGGIGLIEDPLTARPRMLDLGASYPGVTIEGLTNGDGTGGSGVVWFDYESVPHTRSPDGTFEAINTRAVEITTNAGSRIIVHAYSGMVEDL